MVGTSLQTFRVVGAQSPGAPGTTGAPGAPGAPVIGIGIGAGAGPVGTLALGLGPAFGASWATAANGTTARSAPVKTSIRTLNMGILHFQVVARGRRPRSSI